MLNVFKKGSIAQSGVLAGFTDIHSHILPGVDDGVKSDEEAIGILDYYQALGVKKVVFTPHVMEDYPQNTAVFLRARFEQFQHLYRGGVQLALGAEYMLDHRFEEHLESGELLPVIHDYLLVETSYINLPFHFTERLKAIMAKGYFVILAHPERYGYMQKLKDFSQLKETGVLFQMNLLSVTGFYGRAVEKKTKMLLDAGYYDFIGMDIHGPDYLSGKVMNQPVVQRYIEQVLQLKGIVKCPDL